MEESISWGHSEFFFIQKTGIITEFMDGGDVDIRAESLKYLYVEDVHT